MLLVIWIVEVGQNRPKAAARRGELGWNTIKAKAGFRGSDYALNGRVLRVPLIGKGNTEHDPFPGSGTHRNTIGTRNTQGHQAVFLTSR